MILSTLEKAKPSDEKIISRQLRSSRARVYAIAKRCRYGFPSVAVFNCFNSEGKLDPGLLSTPLWLTCPYLNEKIHSFETEGYISSITYLISSDREIHGMMMDAHAHYYFFRKELYRSCSGKSPGDEIIRFMDKGIGGMTEEYGIKCLHLHYSHFHFCSYNVAGMIISKLLKGDVNCQDCRCREL